MLLVLHTTRKYINQLERVRLKRTYPSFMSKFLTGDE